MAVVESKASAVADSNSSLDKDGNVVQTAVPVSSERAMRCSEMLLKLVTKKVGGLGDQKGGWVGMLLCTKVGT